MNDYKSVLKEYQELQYSIENQSNEMLVILNKTNSFMHSIKLLEDELNVYKNISLNDFDYINPPFNNCIEDIHKVILSFNNQVTVPIKNCVENLNFATKKNLDSFNEIKCNLIDKKQKIIKERDTYYDFMKNSYGSSGNKDEIDLSNAKKENFIQLYKYEINGMNETIKPNNEKYLNIYKNLNESDICSNAIIKKSLEKFAINLKDIGNIFIKLSENLNNVISQQKNNVEINWN